MKNLLLGLALAGLTFACNSDQTAQMSDASEVLPACATGPDCDKADMAGCEMMGKSKVGGGCCESKKAEAEKVCPMTGKVIE